MTFAIQAGDQSQTQVWRYPSRSECLTCHTPLAGYALGFNTAQLNRDRRDQGVVQNQIGALRDMGYFSTNAIAMETLPALAHPANDSASVDFRVHSYLVANCVQCHQPGGIGLARFDVRLGTPLWDSGLIQGSLFDSLEDSENRVIVPGSIAHSALLTRLAELGEDHMPPLGTTLPDPLAVALFSDWITNRLTQLQDFPEWQTRRFGSTNAPNAAPQADADGDRAGNYLEYLTGTNPTDAREAWGIDVGYSPVTGPEIRFNALANLGFEVQWTTNLLDPNSWQPLLVPGNAPRGRGPVLSRPRPQALGMRALAFNSRWLWARYLLVRPRSC